MKTPDETGRHTDALCRRILRFIQKHSLVTRGETLVAGVSGGPDSVCLIHVLAALKDELGVRLHIAHLNHMLRGAESDGDAEYVLGLAHELGVEATVERRDVKAYQKEHGLTLEEAAREVRYAFFAEAAQACGAQRVAVGHTADDQVETVLMHLLRGSGLSGLAGMRPATARPKDRLTIIRPLLETRRQETGDYCAAHGLSPRTDSTNLQPVLFRNRIRSQLIPFLKDYNPDIESALVRTASAAGYDLDYVNRQVSRVRSKVVVEKDGDILINREAFSKVHPALKRHLMRSALERLLGDLKDIEYAHIEILVEAMTRRAGKTLSLPRDLTFYADYTHALLSTRGLASYAAPAIDGEIRINIPGETSIPGWIVRSTIIGGREECSDGPFEACFDADSVSGDLRVRSRRDGDRFQPLGMSGAKKLQDFLVDAKAPRVQRDLVPLVCSPAHIVWVVGHRIDERAKVTAATRRTLRLEFEKAKQNGPLPHGGRRGY